MSAPQSFPMPRQERIAVIKSVAKRHGVSFRDVMGVSRLPEAVEARHAAMELVQTLFGDSASRVGRLFKRDHTTVLYALNKMRARA